MSPQDRQLLDWLLARGPINWSSEAELAGERHAAGCNVSADVQAPEGHAV